MKRYSAERKAAVMQKMMPPHNTPIPILAAETGIADVTLYNWRKQARVEGIAVPADGKNPEKWSSEDKFAIVLEAAALNEAELGEYCRQKGLYVEQIEAWRKACLQANANSAAQAKAQQERTKQDRHHIKQPEQELRRKDKALAEAAALLVLQKKSPGDLGGRRGRMISPADRRQAVALIEEAVAAGVRQHKACEVLEISARTFQRWTQGEGVSCDRRPDAPRPVPADKLSEAEREAILKAANSPACCSLPPSQMVPALADQGCYLASESTVYRVLRQAGQQHHRGRSDAPQRKAPSTHCADGANQVWCWDITWLPGPARGLFYYLYLILDLYSRKIIAWEIHDSEASDLAAGLIRKGCLAEAVVSQPLVLHADNGSSMKGASMLETLRRLRITSSFSRPRVSIDNAYAESLFRTCKYRPDYPVNGFATIDEARAWVLAFTRWYNTEHKHSGLKFITPVQRHTGEAAAVLEHRKQVYRDAQARHPNRWSGAIRNWDLPEKVWLNPEKERSDLDKAA